MLLYAPISLTFFTNAIFVSAQVCLLDDLGDANDNVNNGIYLHINRGYDIRLIDRIIE